MPASPSFYFHSRSTIATRARNSPCRKRGEAKGDRQNSDPKNLKSDNICDPGHHLPKGPFRTKNSTESEFRYGHQIRYGRSKTLRRGLRSACSSRKKSQENGTDAEKLRRWQNSTDSSAVLFLVRKGPLGTGVRRGPGRKVPYGVLCKRFWAIASECPRECFFCVFWAFFSALWHSEAIAQNRSKNTPWGTFRPGPLSTPVNGGRDRKTT